ncbi:MAG TPA: glycosyltransferase [Gaiellales bacterium]|jgi:glycosyltransferase involved in cell wall biosynthesis
MADEPIHVAVMNDVIPVSGGAERLIVHQLLALDPARFERTLIVTRWDPAVAASAAGAGVIARLEAAGVRVAGIRRRSRVSPRAWLSVVRLLRRRGVDVLHSHKTGANYAAVVVGRLAGVPVIAHEHLAHGDGVHFGLSRARKLADRHLMGRLATMVLCVSEADDARLVAVEHLPRRKVRLVPLGIPAPETCPPSRADARRELGLAQDDIVIVATAMLRPEKRHDVLVAALARLGPAGAGAVTLVTGDGVPRGALEAQAQSLALGARVRFLGTRTDVPRILAAADIGVLCSDREGTPLALLEYMQAGLGIAATRVGGVPDMIRDGREGLLVAPGSPAELAEALTRLCADPDLRYRLGAAARRRRHDTFDLPGFVHTLEELYGELAGAGTPR